MPEVRSCCAQANSVKGMTLLNSAIPPSVPHARRLRGTGTRSSSAAAQSATAARATRDHTITSGATSGSAIAVNRKLPPHRRERPSSRTQARVGTGSGMGGR